MREGSIVGLPVSNMLASTGALERCPSAQAGRATFLMVPRMPETVRMEAPSNLATSKGLLNMLCTKAVCLWILPSTADISRLLYQDRYPVKCQGRKKADQQAWQPPD